FSVDEFYWEDRSRYYAGLQAVREQGEDLTSWLEYCAEGLLVTLERVDSCAEVFREDQPEEAGPASETRATPPIAPRPKESHPAPNLGRAGCVKARRPRPAPAPHTSGPCKADRHPKDWPLHPRLMESFPAATASCPERWLHATKQSQA